MDWLKKNMILAVVQLVTLLVSSTLLYAGARLYDEMDSKATKKSVEEVKREVVAVEGRINVKFEDAEKLTKEQINTLNTRVTGVENSTEVQMTLILRELESLREDLRLKKDKQ